eukprot:GAHX01002541.1.p1 GENE.GAHX01002541.1~~GAHX01002541.1.p1  ORF type:complete len:172 (+),score=39.77 GAHX01002541.1:33-548(+)
MDDYNPEDDLPEIHVSDNLNMILIEDELPTHEKPLPKNDAFRFLVTMTLFSLIIILIIFKLSSHYLSLNYKEETSKIHSELERLTGLSAEALQQDQTTLLPQIKNHGGRINNLVYKERSMVRALTVLKKDVNNDYGEDKKITKLYDENFLDDDKGIKKIFDIGANFITKDN